MPAYYIICMLKKAPSAMEIKTYRRRLLRTAAVKILNLESFFEASSMRFLVFVIENLALLGDLFPQIPCANGHGRPRTFLTNLDRIRAFSRALISNCWDEVSFSPARSSARRLWGGKYPPPLPFPSSFPLPLRETYELRT